MTRRDLRRERQRRRRVNQVGYGLVAAVLVAVAAAFIVAVVSS